MAKRKPVSVLGKSISRGWTPQMKKLWREVSFFVRSETKLMNKDFTHLTPKERLDAVSYNAGVIAALFIEPKK